MVDEVEANKGRPSPWGGPGKVMHTAKALLNRVRDNDRLLQFYHKHSFSWSASCQQAKKFIGGWGNCLSVRLSVSSCLKQKDCQSTRHLDYPRPAPAMFNTTGFEEPIQCQQLSAPAPNGTASARGFSLHSTFCYHKPL